MRWYKNIKLRTLKKYRSKWNKTGHRYISFQDGVAYPIEMWEKLLDYVNSLKPGDTVWNTYIKEYDTVKEVKFYWSDINRITSKDKEGKVVGKAILEFTVLTNSGYALYDETMHTPDYWTK